MHRNCRERGSGKEGGGAEAPLSLPRGAIVFFIKDRNTQIECSVSNIVKRNRPTLSFLHADI